MTLAQTKGLEQVEFVVFNALCQERSSGMFSLSLSRSRYCSIIRFFSSFYYHLLLLFWNSLANSDSFSTKRLTSISKFRIKPQSSGDTVQLFPALKKWNERANERVKKKCARTCACVFRLCVRTCACVFLTLHKYLPSLTKWVCWCGFKS